MATLIVRHRVADFDAWKKVFDEFGALRAQHGWTGHLVVRDANDPNVVTIVNRVRDAEGARRYGASEDLKKGMMRAGVMGPPEIWLTDDVEEKRL